MECVTPRLTLSFATARGGFGTLTPPAALVAGVVASMRLPLVAVEVFANVRPRVDTDALPATAGAAGAGGTGARAGGGFGLTGTLSLSDLVLSPASSSDSPMSTSTSSSTWSELNTPSLQSPVDRDSGRSATVQAAIALGKMAFARVGTWIPLRVLFRGMLGHGDGAAGAAAVGSTQAVLPRMLAANHLHLRVLGTQDVGRYLAMAAQRPNMQSLTTGSSELEWLADVMVDGWMQGACVQVREGVLACVLSRFQGCAPKGSMAMRCRAHTNWQCVECVVAVYWLLLMLIPQIEAGSTDEREVVFSVCPLVAGEFVLFVEYNSPGVHRSAMVVIQAH